MDIPNIKLEKLDDLLANYGPYEILNWFVDACFCESNCSDTQEYPEEWLQFARKLEPVLDSDEMQALRRVTE